VAIEERVARRDLVACRSEVVTDESAFHKFISIAALHTATEHLACPLTLSLRQATSEGDISESKGKR
jgi:hypothetical protein